MKNFARSIPAEHTLLDRFRTGNDEVFQSLDGRRAATSSRRSWSTQQQHQVIMAILDQLDDREKDIIMYRYGLDAGDRAADAGAGRHAVRRDEGADPPARVPGLAEAA